ncbi:MAG: hypothetical protein PUD59_04450 [bacterium]|nr:hypothetical protein [bacterium]
MINVNEEDYYLIEGGLSFSSSIFNSLTSGIKIILELGRSVGSALRRGSNGTTCKI